MYRTITVIALITGASLAATTISSCSPGRGEDVEKEGSMAERTIEQVQEAYTDAWMAMPGVVGTALGLHEDQPCILILTAANAEAIRAQIPHRVEGYPVIIQHTGEIRARNEP